MRAVWLDVPESFLEERRRLGHDRKDELWDGVLHMVPPGTFVHGSVIGDLTIALDAVARRRGMRAYPSELGVFEHDTNYRVPDITIVRPQHITERGLIGAELVVEVLSPRDESREKQPFYAARAIPESWIVAPRTRVVEIYALRDERYVRIDGHRSPTLGIDVTTIETTDGPRIRICDGEHVADV
jgi:Uma2 family endonuclease